MLAEPSRPAIGGSGSRDNFSARQALIRFSARNGIFAVKLHLGDIS